MPRFLEGTPLINQIKAELSPPKEDLGAAILAAYRILQDPSHVAFFYGVKNPSEEKIRALLRKQLILDLLDYPPGYGVKKTPTYTFKEIRRFDPPPDEIILGQVFPKEGKPFSADLVYSFRTETELCFADYETVPIEITTLIAADGATMRVPSHLWPNEVYQKLSFTYKGESVCYPDVFWRTILQRLFGIKMPTPYPQDLFERVGINNSSWDSWRESLCNRLKSRFSSPFLGLRYNLGDIAEGLINSVNERVGETLRKVFPGFDEKTRKFYPSGVMGVVVITKPLEPIKNWQVMDYLQRLNGWASCGDIRIAVGGRLVNDPTIVDYHDRLLEALAGTDDEIVAAVAGERIYRVGNLQGFPVAIQKRQFRLQRTLPIVACTDGCVINNILAAETFLGKEEYQEEGDDPTARLLEDDPLLTLLLKRRQSRRLEEKGDDFGYIFQTTRRAAEDYSLRLPITINPWG